jgi:CBS domain-containing protein
MVAKSTVSNLERRKHVIDTLHHHSNLSVEEISYQVDMSVKQVQSIIDKIKKNEALEVLVEHGKTPMEKIMTRGIVSLEYNKTVYDASVLMTKKGIGCIVVTAKGKPYGIVTERDIVKGISKIDISVKNILLEEFASRPLIYASSRQTVEDVVELLTKNKIHKIPIVQQDKVVGIVTIKDLLVFLSPMRKPGLTESIIHAITREKAKKK